jgi:alkylation response protein AidB-like acyl-CoA dehydrogenase
MDLLPSPEQAEIESAAAGFLATYAPVSRTRALMGEPASVDPAVWSGAAELGWFGLGLPEVAGGVGCGLADEAVLFREIGRSLAGGPFLATVLAARVAWSAGDAALTDAIVGGAAVGLLALDRSTTTDGGGRLDGAVQLIDAEGTELVLLADLDRASLYRVDDLGGLAAVASIDPAVRLARATARGVEPVATVTSSVDPVGQRGCVLLAALQSGIAAAVRDLAAAHASSRVQFDKPIGVHQGVKHPCADMAVHAELAWAQTLLAALAIDEGRSDAELQALSAKVVAGHAARQGTSATIQVLGGMGFTHEPDASHFLKRAFVLDQLLGDEKELLDRLIDLPAAI